MPTKIKLSWDSKNKCWRKMIKGKRYYLGGGSSKSDLKSYRAAYQEYEKILYNLNKADHEPTLSFNDVEAPDQRHELMKVCYAKKYGGKGMRQADTILGLIDRFIYDMMKLNDRDPPEISAKTLGRYTRGFDHPKYGIIKFLGTRTVGKPDSANNLERTSSRRRVLETYHNQLATWQKQKKKPLGPAYANLFYATMKKWYYWLWEKEHINELPRMIRRLDYFDLPFNKKNQNNFSVEEVRHLYKMAYGQNSKLWSPIMRAWILLGANCAFGGQEVATLTIEEIDFENGRIRRFREKTKIYAEWKLWDVTRKYLTICLDLNKSPLLYADHFNKIPEKRDHRLLFKTQRGNPLIHSRFTPTGPRQVDSINKRFMNLRRKWLEDEHLGNGFKSLRRLSSSLVDDLELNDHARTLSLLLGHMHTGSTAYRSYVSPSFKELDHAVDQLEEIYGFHKIIDEGKKDYYKRFKMSTYKAGGVSTSEAYKQYEQDE